MAVYNIKEAQESLDEVRRREATARREEPDYQAYLSFVDSLEVVEDLRFDTQALEAAALTKFEKVLDDYAITFPEPIKRYWVNAQKLARIMAQQAHDSAAVFSSELLGYFVTHTQSDLETQFAEFLAGKELSGFGRKTIEEIKGKAFTVPSVTDLVAALFVPVFKKLDQEAQKEWDTLIKQLAELKEKKQVYEALLAEAQQFKMRLSEGDIGARRISKILEEVNNQLFYGAISKARAEVITLQTQIRKTNPAQVLSHLETAFYNFFSQIVPVKTG